MSPRPSGRVTGEILHAIDRGHRHGADIVVVTGQAGGTVYKVLRRLEERGLIVGLWEDAAIAERERRPRRRYYKLTSAGQAELALVTERYRALRRPATGRSAKARGA